MAKAKAKPKKPAPKKRMKVQAVAPKKLPPNAIQLDARTQILMEYAPCVYADHIMEVLGVEPDELFPDSMGISREAGELVNRLILSAVQDCMSATLDWVRSAN